MASAPCGTHWNTQYTYVKRKKKLLCKLFTHCILNTVYDCYTSASGEEMIWHVCLWFGSGHLSPPALLPALQTPQQSDPINTSALESENNDGLGDLCKFKPAPSPHAQQVRAISPGHTSNILH
ncbi:hypothetical protein CEXT_58861 [Caerostris extrusa]|uniref:Uncharacterized protein n=1 Tax=Caerostris extrusa TaxID=172846 RepID=A0AAV4QV38_CAEEX|nr:hypothetical protein CEXT_58861 [Caerostris extrusa]